MKLGLYSIFDRKAGAYQGVTASPNDEVAARSLKEQVPGSGITMDKYPEDFELRCVGVIDYDTGDVTPLQTGPRVVSNLGVLFGKEVNN